jgi:hypothetical protein
MQLFRSKNRHNVANQEQFKKARKKPFFSRSKASDLQETSGTGNATGNVPKEDTQHNNSNGEEISVRKLSSASIPAKSTYSSDVNTSTTETQDSSLWSHAYDALKARNQALVIEYEEILSKEYSVNGHSEGSSENIIAQNEPRRRQLQMDEFMKKGQQRMEEMENKSRVFKHDIVSAVNIVLDTKNWIGEALKCSQEASLIWAGVSLIVHLVTNPVTAKNGEHRRIQVCHSTAGIL